jgi:hypothetical protein
MKTAIVTPDGVFIWNVFPMGLANGPPLFQQAVDVLFGDCGSDLFGLPTSKWLIVPSQCGTCARQPGKDRSKVGSTHFS